MKTECSHLCKSLHQVGKSVVSLGPTCLLHSNKTKQRTHTTVASWDIETTKMTQSVWFLSTHWWSQHRASQRWLFLVVSCFFKPFRNCHPSQLVFKVQCKKPAKKNDSILRFHIWFLNRFYVDFGRDFVIFWEILCFFQRFSDAFY